MRVHTRVSYAARVCKRNTYNAYDVCVISTTKRATEPTQRLADRKMVERVLGIERARKNGGYDRSV